MVCLESCLPPACLACAMTSLSVACCVVCCGYCCVAVPTNCPPGLCYNATTKEKFWGFATGIGPLDDLRFGNDSRLDPLKEKRYKWL